MERRDTPQADDRANRHGALFVSRLDAVAFQPQRRAVTHDYLVLVYYTAGDAELELRERLRLGAGDVLLLPAGEPHRTLSFVDVRGWALGFCPACFATTDLADMLAPFERVRAGASAAARIAEDRREHLARLFAELERETSRARDPAHSLVERSLLALILAELARSTAWTEGPGPRPPLVAAALQYIERHCLGPLSLKDVAAAVGRTPAHLTTALRQATGRTAQAWIIAGRMGEARRRLLATDAPVEDIAAHVGYADPSHFIRLFRREHSMPPAAWRALHRRAPAPSSARG